MKIELADQGKQNIQLFDDSSLSYLRTKQLPDYIMTREARESLSAQLRSSLRK